MRIWLYIIVFSSRIIIENFYNICSRFLFFFFFFFLTFSSFATRFSWSHNSKERFSRRDLYRKRKWKYKWPVYLAKTRTSLRTHAGVTRLLWFFAVCTPFNICNLLFSKVKIDDLSRTHIFQNDRKYWHLRFFMFWNSLLPDTKLCLISVRNW